MDKLIGPISVMINAYADGTIDELHIVYTRFVNTMKQEPTLEQLLPLSTKHMAVEHSHPWDYQFEPDVKSVLDFLVRRYLDMAVILPYVLWITLLAFAMDYLLRQLARRAFPWYYGRGGEGAAT